MARFFRPLTPRSSADVERAYRDLRERAEALTGPVSRERRIQRIECRRQGLDCRLSVREVGNVNWTSPAFGDSRLQGGSPGLCSRALRFGAGISLEQLTLRHALELAFEDLSRASLAAGVMMIPIPRGGRLVQLDGQEQVRAVLGAGGLEITITRGRPVLPLPEGERYLGFLFARGSTADAVERSLEAHPCLRIRIESPSRPEAVVVV